MRVVHRDTVAVLGCQNCPLVRHQARCALSRMLRHRLSWRVNRRTAGTLLLLVLLLLKGLRGASCLS